jgi:hypothetical protein
LGRYDNNEFDEALGEFEKVSDTSKILFNMGVIHATLGEHEKAVCTRFLCFLPFTVRPGRPVYRTRQNANVVVFSPPLYRSSVTSELSDWISTSL